MKFAGHRSSPEPERFGEGCALLSDGFSMLLASEASLAQLAERTGLSYPAQRTRPNLVVEGCAAHGEDSWTSLLWSHPQHKSKSAELRLPKPCARCMVPRLDP